MEITFKPNDVRVEPKHLYPELAGIDGVCEADDYSRFMLWKEWHPRLDSWVQGDGRMCNVGTLDGRPINVTLFFSVLNGKRICFYDACSQLVDWVLVEAWVEKHLCYAGQPKSDANNFHNVLSTLGVKYKCDEK